MTAQDTPQEVLEDGWQPSTPVSDTLMRRIVYTLADEAVSNVELLGGRIERRDNLVATDLGRPAAFFNSCILTQLMEPSTTTAQMSFLDDFFDAGGASTGMVVLISAWPTPDLADYGWSLMGHPPAHLRPAGGNLPPDPAGVDISRVTSLDDLIDWEQGAIRGYPFDELSELPSGSAFAPDLLNDPRHHFWMARTDGRVAGVSVAFVEHGLCYVSLVATLPEARGRGIGTALTWRATLADPSLPAALLSSDDGRPVYERMGYLPLTRLTLWFRLRPGR
jgi:GNAT superfamily N-acetyltransferase